MGVGLCLGDTLFIGLFVNVFVLVFFIEAVLEIEAVLVDVIRGERDGVTVRLAVLHAFEEPDIVVVDVVV